MELTSENYFSPSMQMKYMGSSQYKSFSRCEAMALAELHGEYVRPTTTALLVGSYVDAHFEGTLDLFAAQHPELFKRDGTLKAEYLQANDIIARLEADELFSMLMSGRKQVVKTGTIAGVPFKIKIDSLLDADTTDKIAMRFPDAALALGLLDGAIVDLKIMRDMADVWSDEAQSRVSFVEAWGYDLQGAIYQAVEGNMLPFILAVGTKETVTDLAALSIADRDLSAKVYEIEHQSPRFQAIKEGRVAPTACGHCDYCRGVKRLTKIVDYREAGLC